MDDATGEDDDDCAPSPLGTPPIVPNFLLPPERVIITQLTPETEFSPAHQGIIKQYKDYTTLFLFRLN